MTSERYRLLTLALETLLNKKRTIDEEIAQYSSELRGSTRGRAITAARGKSSAVRSLTVKKQFAFSKEERLRRSQRMKAYWENWRKQRSR